MAELRSTKRLPLILSVRADGRRVLTENVSEAGLFIETDETYEPGQVVRLELSFPGLLEPIEMSGTVAWFRPLGASGPAGVGVKLSDAEQSRQPILGQLVRAALANEEPLPAPSEPYRILIADDSPNSADLYGYAMRKLASHEWGPGVPRLGVEFAHDGSEAWRRLQHDPFPLLLTDLYMPVMDGFDLIAKVRADPALSQTRILVISAGDDEALKRARGLGADGVLHKPAQVTDLIFTVRALLRWQQQRPR